MAEDEETARLMLVSEETTVVQPRRSLRIGMVVAGCVACLATGLCSKELVSRLHRGAVENVLNANSDATIFNVVVIGAKNTNPSAVVGKLLSTAEYFPESAVKESFDKGTGYAHLADPEPDAKGDTKVWRMLGPTKGGAFGAKQFIYNFITTPSQPAYVTQTAVAASLADGALLVASGKGSEFEDEIEDFTAKLTIAAVGQYKDAQIKLVIDGAPDEDRSKAIGEKVEAMVKAMGICREDDGLGGKIFDYIAIDSQAQTDETESWTSLLQHFWVKPRFGDEDKPLRAPIARISQDSTGMLVWAEIVQGTVKEGKTLKFSNGKTSKVKETLWAGPVGEKMSQASPETFAMLRLEDLTPEDFGWDSKALSNPDKVADPEKFALVASDADSDPLETTDSTPKKGLIGTMKIGVRKPENFKDIAGVEGTCVVATEAFKCKVVEKQSEFLVHLQVEGAVLEKEVPKEWKGIMVNSDNKLLFWFLFAKYVD